MRDERSADQDRDEEVSDAMQDNGLDSMETCLSAARQWLSGNDMEFRDLKNRGPLFFERLV